MDIEHVFFAYGKTEIFNDISLHVNNHDHIGVVGVNGAGKSTLFHLILGDYQPDFGTITTSENTRIAYLPQVIKDEIPDMKITVEEYLRSARPLKELEADGLVHREEYPQIPPKVEYSLTERGKSLIPILDSMCDWGAKNRI